MIRNPKNPIFLKHGDVIVRRCWHPNHQDILSDDMFSTNENPHVRESPDGAFNVTTLSTFPGKPYSNVGRRSALREAIEKRIGPFAQLVNQSGVLSP